MSGMELPQGEAWPSFGECERVFISFKLFSPADGHPMTVASTQMDLGNPGFRHHSMNRSVDQCNVGLVKQPNI